MAGRRITREHLGAEATDRDVAVFEEAVERLAEDEFGGDSQAAEDYLWGDGDYIQRLPSDLRESYYS